MKEFLKQLRHLKRLIYWYYTDLVDNMKYLGFHKDTNLKIVWRLLLLSHSLEKGLSMSNGRKDFGYEKALELSKYFLLYEKKINDLLRYEYIEAMSIMRRYIHYRLENDLSINNLHYREDLPMFPAGYEKINKDNLQYNAKSFQELCDKRHSVREFSNECIKKYEIENVIKLVSLAPTACNRQMIKIYCSMEKEVNKKLSVLIPGNKGYENENCIYLFIVADQSAFDDFEINQWFLNGGIVLAFMQLGFTAYGIGSCIYQWIKDLNTDMKAKKVLSIPENEIILSVMAIGNYKDEVNVLCSHKKDFKEFIVYR